MPFTHPRMRREQKTIEAMFAIYCRSHHSPLPGRLCDSCQALQDYALERLDRCIYQENKPTCANCPVHCYKPDMRQKVRQMMRYAGPRMLPRHPILAVHHMLDGRRKAPALPKRSPAAGKTK